jgi:hypothetical protein
VEGDGKGKVQAVDQFGGHRELLFQDVRGEMLHNSSAV